MADNQIESYILREHVYLSKLAEKEREIAHYKQIANDIQSRFEGQFEKTSLRFAMVDPTVNMEILRLRQKIKAKDQEVDGLKQELKATQFKPTSISGQKLMKKCRVLLEENQSLGRQISEGPIQDLLVALGAEREEKRHLKEKLREETAFRQALDEENASLSTELEILYRKLEDAQQEVAQQPPGSNVLPEHQGGGTISTGPGGAGSSSGTTATSTMKDSLVGVAGSDFGVSGGNADDGQHRRSSEQHTRQRDRSRSQDRKTEKRVGRTRGADDRGEKKKKRRKASEER